VKNLKVTRQGDRIIIGDTPQLVIDLKNQDNYIKVQDKRIPYRKEVLLSDDLLAGKREKVFATAVKYYYRQACEVAEGMKAAELYRSKINTDIREIK